MRQNEINRIEIESAMERFFAGGGSITKIPVGVSGESILGLRPALRKKGKATAEEREAWRKSKS